MTINSAASRAVRNPTPASRPTSIESVRASRATTDTPDASEPGAGDSSPLSPAGDSDSNADDGEAEDSGDDGSLDDVPEDVGVDVPEGSSPARRFRAEGARRVGDQAEDRESEADPECGTPTSPQAE